MQPKSIERMLFRIKCPSCGVASEEVVARLINKRKIVCRAPGCRKPIDLQTPYHRSLIQKLSACCGDLDALVDEPTQLA
jgi:hypothetical protein